MVWCGGGWEMVVGRRLVGFAADLRAAPVDRVHVPPTDSWGSVESALAFAEVSASPSAKRARTS